MELMCRVLYFDCLSGISGDMTIGALLDVGVNQEALTQELSKLHVPGYRLEITKRTKSHITGTDFCVVLEEADGHGHHQGEHACRNLFAIETLIDQSVLSDSVKALSKRIFGYVANAEAKIHGRPVEDIHFHEVGAIDSIVDIVGAAICVEMLGVDEIYASPLHLGTGFVKCAHGRIPVPAPATLEILKGVPVYSTGVRSELVTPTGAAILRGLVKEFGPLPELMVEQIGYGTGKKDLEIPNLLRVLIGKKKPNKGW